MSEILMTVAAERTPKRPRPDHTCNVFNFPPWPWVPAGASNASRGGLSPRCDWLSRHLTKAFLAPKFVSPELRGSCHWPQSQLAFISLEIGGRQIALLMRNIRPAFSDAC